MKTALPRSDDERVPRRSSVEELSPLPGELMPGFTSKRLTGAKPPVRVGRHSVANLGQGRMEWMVIPKGLDIQDVAGDEGFSPLAVTPELDAANGNVRCEDVAECLRPRTCRYDQVSDAPRPRECRAGDPGVRESDATSATGVVVNYTALAVRAGLHGIIRLLKTQKFVWGPS